MWCGRLWMSTWRAHADPVFVVQQPSQVRPAFADGAQHWGEPHCDGALRGERVRSAEGTLDSEAACGPGQGSDVFSLRADAGAVGAHAVSPWRLTKPEVREVARQHGLKLAEKPDSQEICFIPGGDYKQFLTAYLEEQGEPMPETLASWWLRTGKCWDGTKGFPALLLGSVRAEG